MKFSDIVKDIVGVRYYQKNKSGVRYFSGNYKNCGIYKRKNFSARKYGARRAFEMALNFRKAYENLYGVPTTYTQKKDILKVENKYILKRNCFYLIISHKEVNKEFRLKFSISDLPLINGQYWYLDINGKTPGESISTYYNNKTMYISEILFPDKKSSEKLNHKNRDLSDYTRENIFLDTAVKYLKAHTYEETNKAIPGVCLSKKKYKDRYYLYWKASYWKEGKQRQFSIKKYGFEGAKKLAEEQRREWEEEFEENKEGANGRKN